MADQPVQPPSEKPTELPASGAAPTAPVVVADPAPAKPVEAKPAEVAPETKPVEAAEPAEPAKAEEPAKAPETPEGVPEKYEIKLEGAEIHPVMVEALTPIWKEAGLNTKQVTAQAQAFMATQEKLIPLIVQRDLDALKADPVLGQLNLGRTQARVNDALAAFTTPEERASLEKMGLSNNPTLVRMFHRIGLSMQEPPQADSGSRVPESRSRASKLYGGNDLVVSKPN